MEIKTVIFNRKHFDFPIPQEVEIAIDNKEKRDAYDKLLDFINSKRCYEGTVCVLYGLRGTGKKTVMKQIIADNADKLSFVWIETTNKDTMDDVYNALDEAVHNKINCVFIDEITNVPNFIDDSALLADIYAKEGIRIILAGTDSLGFTFAENSPLYGRTENICTTYIPFEEYLRVFGAKDINDYIRLMKAGFTKEEHIVYDYQSARRYIDDVVAGNIYRSLQRLAKYDNHDALFDVTPAEMSAALDIMIRKYSGELDFALVNEELRKIISPISEGNQYFDELEETEILRNLRNSKFDNSDHDKEFAEEINAGERIAHKFTEDMFKSLEIYLICMGFISATREQELIYDENDGWDSSPLYKEHYLVQPAIKYYYLKKALECVESNEHYCNLTEDDKRFVMDRLDLKIREDMAAQIVLFETTNALPRDRYFTHKISFAGSSPNKPRGKYDMLIYDRADNSYHVFAIKNTTDIRTEHYRNLLNEAYKEIVDYKYGKREGAYVLYNGKPFKTTSGASYLNISDFVKEIARHKDVKVAMQNLSGDL